MKRFLALLFALISVLSLVVLPCSAFSFENSGVIGTYSSMSGSYSQGEYTMDKLIFPSELSGVEDPISSCDMAISFDYRFYPSDYIYGDILESFMRNHFIPEFYTPNKEKKLTYEESKEWFSLGQINKQNGFTYDYISIDSMSGGGRIAYISSPYGNEDITKVLQSKGKYYSIQFTIYFENYTPNMPLPYDTKPGEGNARNDDIVGIDYQQYIYPEVHLDKFYQIEGKADAFVSYLTLFSCRISPKTTSFVRSMKDRQTYPTIVFYSNYLAPIHNRIYFNNDTRYNFVERSYNSVELSLGQPGKEQIDGRLTGGLSQTKINQPFSTFTSYKAKVDTVFYYMALETKDIALYETHDFEMIFDHYFTDSNGGYFPIYYEISTVPRLTYSTSSPFSNYPLSFGGWSVYKPIGGIFDFIANGDGVTDENYYERFYVNIAPKGDNALEKIGNVFTQTIPNIANNALIWFMCESPLISNLTRPVFLSAKKAGDMVTQIVLPILTSAGLLGVIFVCTLLLNIIRRFIFK